MEMEVEFVEDLVSCCLTLSWHLANDPVARADDVLKHLT
jgi:hypothetical protein